MPVELKVLIKMDNYMVYIAQKVLMQIKMENNNTPCSFVLYFSFAVIRYQAAFEPNPTWTQTSYSGLGVG